MKKYICLLMAALMVFSCACGKKTKTGADARKEANEIYHSK